MKTFEDQYEIIIKEINKRRHKWTLKAIAWLDFDDVSQLILIHINKKWDLWDQSKDFLPWLNTVISHQITNMLRNLYMNVARPCVSCSANEGGDHANGDGHCRIYVKQCSACPLYANWEKTKKRAHDVKLPVSIENHLQETSTIPTSEEEVENKAELLHKRMKEVLSTIQYKVYKLLYIDGKTDAEVADMMGYKSSEKHRNIGYRQIHNMKKTILEKAKKIISTEFY